MGLTAGKDQLKIKLLKPNRDDGRTNRDVACQNEFAIHVWNVRRNMSRMKQ